MVFLRFFYGFQAGVPGGLLKKEVLIWFCYFLYTQKWTRAFQGCFGDGRAGDDVTISKAERRFSGVGVAPKKKRSGCRGEGGRSKESGGGWEGFLLKSLWQRGMF